MQASDDEDNQSSLNMNGSLNETAHSMHFEHLELDKAMKELNDCLCKFIKTELMVGIRLDNLDDQLKNIEHKALLPVPWVYFLPHSILILNKRISNVSNGQIRDIRELATYIANLNREGYSTAYELQTNEINIKVHNSSELTKYNIRALKVDRSLHRYVELLDSKCLIDKLYEYYERFYDKVYFKETTILMLYWAHQKELLHEIISQHSIKLLVICIFINFGYGVTNVIHQSSNSPEKKKNFSRMHSFSKINNRGQTQIDPDLIAQYTNYTIQEKRGFYMVSKKHYMQIKDILPIHFPIVSLMKAGEVAQEKEEIDRNIRVVLQHDRENMSICKNIYKIFKFLHNKLEKRMRFIVDIEEKTAYRQEYCQNFELEIIHPVLGTSICKLKEHSIRKLKAQINMIYSNFTDQKEAIDIIKNMLIKNRV